MTERTTNAKDVVLPLASLPEGRGVAVLRQRGEALEAGVVSPVAEGRPLHGELVMLRAREGTPLYDVDVQYAPPRSEPTSGDEAPRTSSAQRTKTSLAPRAPRHASSAERSGPAQVATPAFREGWEGIWGRRDREVN